MTVPQTLNTIELRSKHNWLGSIVEIIMRKTSLKYGICSNGHKCKCNRGFRLWCMWFTDRWLPCLWRLIPLMFLAQNKRLSGVILVILPSQGKEPPSIGWWYFRLLWSNHQSDAESLFTVDQNTQEPNATTLEATYWWVSYTKYERPLFCGCDTDQDPNTDVKLGFVI